MQDFQNAEVSGEFEERLEAALIEAQRAPPSRWTLLLTRPVTLWTLATILATGLGSFLFMVRDRPELYDTSLSILKYVSVGLAGAFGVIGLLTKYRDDDGNITVWGRLALIGILTSSAISATAQSLEGRRETTKAEANQKQAQRVLHEISRTLQPLSEFTVSISISLPIDDDEKRSFEKALNDFIKTNREARPGRRLDGTFGVYPRRDPNVYYLQLKNMKGFSPPTFANLKRINFNAGFYKQRITEKDWAPFLDKSLKRNAPLSVFLKEPDLSFGAAWNSARSHYLLYDSVKAEFQARAFERPPTYTDAQLEKSRACWIFPAPALC